MVLVCSYGTVADLGDSTPCRHANRTRLRHERVGVYSLVMIGVERDGSLHLRDGRANALTILTAHDPVAAFSAYTLLSLLPM